MQQEDLEVITAERDRLKQKLTEQSFSALKLTSVWLFVLGAVILALWFLTNNGSGMSMLIFLSGITLITFAVLIYFISPGKYLRSEVSDGEALSNTINVGKILSGLLIEARGIYLPSSQAGAVKVFIPTSDHGQIAIEALKAPGSIFVLPRAGARGVLLDPPGYGLLCHARQIGVAFTEERLESELKDIVEKGMELAGRADVKWRGDEIQVSLSDMTNKGLCSSVRSEHPGICTQIGCPVCSFLACAVAEGTGTAVRIKNVTVAGRTLRTTLELVSAG